MLSAAYVLSFLLMIVLPIILGIWLLRKLKLSWKLLLAGALTFIASQVLHIPLVLRLTGAFADGTLPTIPITWRLILNAVMLGLLAGLFEETARWVLFKFILRHRRTWEEGVLVGAGHGGIEALLLGASAALAFFSMLAYRSADLSTVPSIPVDQLELARQQVAAYWAAPVYLPFVAPLERIFVLCIQVALSVMVLYALATGWPVWFWLAVMWHALVDGAAVYLGQKFGILASEMAVGLLAVASLWLLFWLRGRFPQAQPSPVPATLLAADHPG